MIKCLIFLLVISFGFNSWSQKADSTLLKEHLDQLVLTEKPRNYQNLKVLNQVADYIHNHFRLYTDSVSFQNYVVKGDTFKNVIASYNTQYDERIVVGAHYDVCGNQPGADDNASGVAGLLELARLLSGNELNKRIDLVAYTLEEPPFFRSEYMGSYVHAKSLYDSEANVLGMICLEMIGYFNDEKGSQDYPLGFLKLFYGKRGDYITVVRKFSNGSFPRKFKRKMKKLEHIETKSFQAPGRLTGIDFSDHLNYWGFGFSAVMVTNTGFYRNKNYHQRSDKLETLDLTRMTGVVQSVYESLVKMASN